MEWKHRKFIFTEKTSLGVFCYYGNQKINVEFQRAHAQNDSFNFWSVQIQTLFWCGLCALAFCIKKKKSFTNLKLGSCPQWSKKKNGIFIWERVFSLKQIENSFENAFLAFKKIKVGTSPKCYFHFKFFRLQSFCIVTSKLYI